jgi:hypothetical protein
MAGEYPIPQNLVEAFRIAIITLWSSDDAVILLDGKEFSIGEIADFASNFNDPMPDDICAYLSVIAAMGDKRPENTTFAAGGRCLRRLYDDLVRRRAAIWE